MSNLRAQFSHLVHLIYALTRQEIETIEVLFVVREAEFVFTLFHRDHRFKDCALTLLQPLTHRVQVRRKIYGSREDTFQFLTLTLPVELLPPLIHEVQFRLEIGQHLNLFPAGVEQIAHGSILLRDVLGIRRFGRMFFHIGRTFHEQIYVKARTSNGQETHRRQYAEAAAHIVGDHVTLIAFFVGRCACSSLFRIRDGYDHAARRLLAAFFLAQTAQEAKGQCRFRRRSRL